MKFPYPLELIETLNGNRLIKTPMGDFVVSDIKSLPICSIWFKSEDTELFNNVYGYFVTLGYSPIIVYPKGVEGKIVWIIALKRYGFWIESKSELYLYKKEIIWEEIEQDLLYYTLQDGGESGWNLLWDEISEFPEYFEHFSDMHFEELSFFPDKSPSERSNYINLMLQFYGDKIVFMEYCQPLLKYVPSMIEIFHLKATFSIKRKRISRKKLVEALAYLNECELLIKLMEPGLYLPSYAEVLWTRAIVYARLGESDRAHLTAVQWFKYSPFKSMETFERFIFELRNLTHPK